jgi:hypothetical protein
MNVSQQVLIAVEDGVRGTNGRSESALLHACLAIDATARLLYPNKGVGDRYTQCIRDYMWLIEPMMGVGLNLVDTIFENVTIKTSRREIINPDFADIVYHNFRCHLAHGEEISSNFAVTLTISPSASDWYLGPGAVHMPDRLIWALLSVAVFSRVHKGVQTTGDHCLTFQNHEFLISEWWGREEDVRSLFVSENTTRVTLSGFRK